MGCFRRGCQHVGDYSGASDVPLLLPLLLLHDMPLAWKISALTFKAGICKPQHVKAGVGKLWPVDQIWLTTCFCTLLNCWRDKKFFKEWYFMTHENCLKLICIIKFDKFLPEPSHSHLLIYYQWLLLCLSSRFRCFQQRLYGLQSLKYLLSGSLQKTFANPCVKGSYPSDSPVKLWNWIREPHPRPQESESEEGVKEYAC